MNNSGEPIDQSVKEAVEAVEATKDISVPNESASESEAEEFAGKIMRRAASLSGVKIERDVFLRTTIKKYCPEIDADLAVSTTPIMAGISASQLDSIARGVIDFETKKCAGLSFLSGIPGGVAMVGTVPADLAQYFAHVMRVEQKLAYLYGWQSFLNDSDEIDDETVMELVVLMGVMMEVGGAANSITKFATNVAQKGVQKTIQRQALTKTTFYPIMKKVLRVVGVKLTKETFAKATSKVVPVIGGFVSGGLTYASFKPGAERLRKYLRALPISGIDTTIPEVIPESYLENTLEAASDAVGNITLAASEQAKIAGTVISEKAQSASVVIADGAQFAAGVLSDGAKSAGSLLGSLKKRGTNFKKTLDVKNKEDMGVSVPECFTRLRNESNNSLVESYGFDSEEAQCLITIEAKDCDDFDDTSALIDRIHANLNDNQGLVEVGNGTTENGNKCIYSIIKSGLEPFGMEYVLAFNLERPEGAMQLQGHFRENGTTGVRDSIVYEIARRDYETTEELQQNWMRDPYDENYTSGIRMNKSEAESYDVLFPNHPLSITRATVAFIMKNN